jgi:predicted metal-dependent enzyme (double-stranded beta helix superfamily)
MSRTTVYADRDCFLSFRYPKHVAMVLRLCKNWFGKGHIIYGDSAFASVATVSALLERGCYFIGMLKTASAGFPKTFLHNDAWKKEHEDDPEPKRGDTRHVTAEIEVSGSKRNVYGHAWNEPGTAGLPKKVLVSSCGDTLPTDPHIKKRFKVSETDARYGEVIERYVPRVSIVKQYFNAACQIDVHNHLRQGVIGIEDHVGTNCHIFRLFCTIFSMSMVDAYKMYYKLRTNDDEVLGSLLVS